MAEYRDYLVPLSPRQVLDRLQIRIGAESILGILDPTDKPVVGFVRSDRFRLRTPRGFTSNAFAPHLYGWITPTPEGTRIRTRLSMSRFATGLIVVWMGALIVASLAGLARGDGAQFLGSAGMTVILLFFMALCRWMDRSHEDLLRRFADETFHVPTNTLNPP